MEFLRDTHIDFMKYRKLWIIVSLALIGVGVVALFFTSGLNVGVDFAGGTQINLRFREHPDIDRLRGLLARNGMGDAQIQRFGKEEENEVVVKTRLAEGTEEGSLDRVVGALDREFNQGLAGKLDLNRAGADAIVELLLRTDPNRVAAQGPEAARANNEATAQALLTMRREDGLFRDWNEVASAPGVSPRAVEALKQGATLGNFSVLGVENVGPQVGRELRRQGFMAVALSLLGMLVYIWIRFELRFGIGAVMASLHDVLVTLGLFALFGFEFNLTTVAAFLTLIGYSVNDTVVIFDRIRENMRKSRRKPLVEVMNDSINQTLSRTILTGGSTLLTVTALLVLGGDVLRGFAFVMTVGILVGTYSSIYIASPFALLWEQMFGAEARAKKGQPAVPAPSGGGTGGGATVRPGPGAAPRRPAGGEESLDRGAARPRSSAPPTRRRKA